jgi:hypothetical protein
MGAGYAAVKSAFESTYSCLGITCEQVGGYLLNDEAYNEGAAPCGFSQITKYDPDTDVTQHNMLDKDQAEIEDFLAENPPNFAKAKAIYENGANSGARGKLTVAELQTDLEKAALVSQDGVHKGKLKSAAGQGATKVDVTYTSNCVATPESASFDTSGCFTDTSEVSVAGTNIGTPTVVANTYRSLAGFSLQAGEKMTGHATFEKFKLYYGRPDYGDAYIQDAFAGSGAWAGKAPEARLQGVKKGSAYMNVWMYTIREMEDAIDDCESGCKLCNMDPVHAWDEAVAFYSGSLEGTDGSGSGKMLYALADKRCENFKTCSGGSASGTSQVNIDIINQFKIGQHALNDGKCGDLPAIRDKIISLMTVPLVQGSLRYAYKSAQLNGKTPKNLAEGAVFAAAVLPLISSCNAVAAKTISDNMKIDSAYPMGTGYAAVKSAFESTYSCLGITCEQVGGIVLNDEAYSEGAAPCGEDSSPEEYDVDGAKANSICFWITSLVFWSAFLHH